MKVCVPVSLLVLLLGAVVSQHRQGPPAPCTTAAAGQEPVSLESLQRLVQSLQATLASVARDVAHTRTKADLTAMKVTTLTDHLLRSSCSDVTSALGSGSSFSRQTSSEDVVTLYLANGQAKRVKCDSSSDGDPGWTVVLLRRDGSVLFNRTLQDYRQGFGHPTGEVWLGLDVLHELTQARPQQLRVEMKRFGPGGRVVFAGYKQFSVGNSSTQYRLSVEEFDGRSSAPDALKDHNNMQFSAIDVDRDTKVGVSCATVLGGGGGWWYASCYHALGTGQYRPSGQATDYGGIVWYDYVALKQSLMQFKMLIKPRD